MAYRDIPDTEIDQDSPVTVQLMSALRDNVQATAQHEDDAPINYGTWHPYNKVTYGDSNTGIIYDSSVDGAVASIDTPNFEDGFEYQMVFFDLQPATGSTNFNVEFFKETDGAWQDALPQNTLDFVSGGANRTTGILTFPFPRVEKQKHIAILNMSTAVAGSSGSSVATTIEMYDSTLQKLRNGRILAGSGNIDEGKCYLLRRKAHIE